MLLDSTTTTRRTAAPAASSTSRADEPLDLEVVTDEGPVGEVLPSLARLLLSLSTGKRQPP
jgi:hypothetical protein